LMPKTVRIAVPALRDPISTAGSLCAAGPVMTIVPVATLGSLLVTENVEEFPGCEMGTSVLYAGPRTHPETHQSLPEPRYSSCHASLTPPLMAGELASCAPAQPQSKSRARQKYRFTSTPFPSPVQLIWFEWRRRFSLRRKRTDNADGVRRRARKRWNRWRPFGLHGCSIRANSSRTFRGSRC
jgi:hypothetical protein